MHGLERLDIVRHLATPAHVKTRRGNSVTKKPSAAGHKQSGLSPPFPAVQGLPCDSDTCSEVAFHRGEESANPKRGRRQEFSEKISENS
jgi:hypothetical protein